MRKIKNWKIGSTVIFNDMGNWGCGLIVAEGEPSESSRWYWVEVKENISKHSQKKKKRLLRADDLCSCTDPKWKTICKSMKRIQKIRDEKKQLLELVEKTFEEEFDDKEDIVF